MVDDGSGRGVSRAGEVEHFMRRGDLRIPGPAALVEAGDDPGRTDLVLEPPVQPVSRVERVPDQRQVSDLAGGAVGAAHELVVDDDPHADSGANRDEHRRRDAPGQAEPLLADCREVHVVLDQYRQIEPVADCLERVESALGCDVVGQRRDSSAGLIDDPRRRDTERQRPTVHGAGFVDHLADHLEHLRADRAAAVPGGRLLQVADRLAEQVGCGDADVASADVAADHESGPRVDHVGNRLAPALAASPPGRADEAALLEPADS